LFDGTGVVGINGQQVGVALLSLFLLLPLLVLSQFDSILNLTPFTISNDGQQRRDYCEQTRVRRTGGGGGSGSGRSKTVLPPHADAAIGGGAGIAGENGGASTHARLFDGKGSAVYKRSVLDCMVGGDDERGERRRRRCQTMRDTVTRGRDYDVVSVG
jgi:hypothetical protein